MCPSTFSKPYFYLLNAFKDFTTSLKVMGYIMKVQLGCGNERNEFSDVTWVVDSTAYLCEHFSLLVFSHTG